MVQDRRAAGPSLAAFTNKQPRSQTVRQCGASPISLAHVLYYLAEAPRFRNEFEDSFNICDGGTCIHQAFESALLSRNASRST